MSDFSVTLIACVAGNPNKAWWDGEEPNDVWEEQTHPFTDLDAAKYFIESLPAETTTHVKLYAGETLIFDQDADADHLDNAGPDVPMVHLIDRGGVPTAPPVADAPPLMPSQVTP